MPGCADVVDIGETAYAMVLADDLDGNGMLDLLLATMNGNLYAFQTAMPANPLPVWPSQVRHYGWQLMPIINCQLTVAR